MKIKQGHIVNKKEVGDHIIKTLIIPKPKYISEAMASDAKDHTHVLLVDYDETMLNRVKKDITYLATDKKLGPFFLYQTDVDSWHLRIPNKLPYQQLPKIMRKLHCDEKILTEIKGKKKRTCHRTSKRGPKKKPQLKKIKLLPPEKEISKKHWDYIKKHDANEEQKQKMERYEQEYSQAFDNSKLDNLKMVYYQSTKEPKGKDGS